MKEEEGEEKGTTLGTKEWEAWAEEVRGEEQKAGVEEAEEQKARAEEVKAKEARVKEAREQKAVAEKVEEKGALLFMRL